MTAFALITWLALAVGIGVGYWLGRSMPRDHQPRPTVFATDSDIED